MTTIVNVALLIGGASDGLRVEPASFDRPGIFMPVPNATLPVEPSGLASSSVRPAKPFAYYTRRTLNTPTATFVFYAAIDVDDADVVKRLLAGYCGFTGPSRDVAKEEAITLRRGLERLVRECEPILRDAPPALWGRLREAMVRAKQNLDHANELRNRRQRK